MPTAIATRHARMVGRRPALSATPPRRSDPSAMPSNSMERTQPSVALSMPQSFAIPGEAKLIDRTSNPSRAFSPMVTSTASHCPARMVPSSMMDFGALPVMFPPVLGDAVLFVNAGQQLDQLGHFLFGKARLEPLLVLLDGTLGRRERPAPRSREVQSLLATVTAGFLAHEVSLRFETVHDGHRRGAIHAHALGDTGLRDVRVVRDQPQGGDLLLREVQVREGLGEMPVDGTVSQANVKAHDIMDLADVLITHDVRCGDGDRLLLL